LGLLYGLHIWLVNCSLFKAKNLINSLILIFNCFDHLPHVILALPVSQPFRERHSANNNSPLAE